MPITFILVKVQENAPRYEMESYDFSLWKYLQRMVVKPKHVLKEIRCWYFMFEKERSCDGLAMTDKKYDVLL